MSEESGAVDDGTQVPSLSVGDVPIVGEGSTLPAMSAGNQPIAGDQTIVTQRVGGSIIGENTQTVVAGRGLRGEVTQPLREAGVTAEGTAPIAKDAGDS